MSVVFVFFFFEFSSSISEFRNLSSVFLLYVYFTSSEAFPSPDLCHFFSKRLNMLSKVYRITNRNVMKEWRWNSDGKWNEIVEATFLRIVSGRHGRFIVHLYILTHSDRRLWGDTMQASSVIQFNNIWGSCELQQQTVIDVFTSLIIRINCSVLISTQWRENTFIIKVEKHILGVLYSLRT